MLFDGHVLEEDGSLHVGEEDTDESVVGVYCR